MIIPMFPRFPCFLFQSNVFRIRPNWVLTRLLFVPWGHFLYGAFPYTLFCWSSFVLSLDSCCAQNKFYACRQNGYHCVICSSRQLVVGLAFGVASEWQGKLMKTLTNALSRVGAVKQPSRGSRNPPKWLLETPGDITKSHDHWRSCVRNFSWSISFFSLLFTVDLSLFPVLFFLFVLVILWGRLAEVCHFLFLVF